MRLFIYLSEILGKKVVNSDGHLVGKVCDIAIYLNDDAFPRAETIVVVKGIFRRRYVGIPMGEVESSGRDFRLKIGAEKIEYQKEYLQRDFLLCRHVLDQQVVDTQGQKVVRVNDVHLLQVDNQLYLAHVDIGLRGLVRRLGWTVFVDIVVRIFSQKSLYFTQEEFISWRNSQVLTVGRGKNVLRSDMARRKLARIPPTELADIMADLDVFEKLSLFKSFNEDLQRKVFTDMAPQEKEEIIDQLDDKEAVSLLENIPADEATDLLMNLPKDKIFQWMRLMHSATSKKLRKLLGFAKDSAGGLMTTEYLYLNEGALVKDAMQKIKDNVEYSGNIFHVYIVDDKHRLIGETSLRRFINSDPEMLLMETCSPNKIFVRTDDGVEEVALLLEKYKFSSIPVLNANEILQGVITSDDVMEELISLTWKKYEGQL